MKIKLLIFALLVCAGFAFGQSNVTVVNKTPSQAVPVNCVTGCGSSSGSSGGPATIADGADTAEGSTTDATVGAGAAGTISAKLRRISTDLDAFKTAQHTDATAPIAAGTNVIGKVGIDPAANTVQLSNQTLTLTDSSVTTGATITSGKHHIEFILSSDFAGTIDGVTYTGTSDQYKAFDAPAGYVFPSVAYTITAGSARLTTF